MGGPGAGKGTMSAKIIEKFNIHHISTGDIFRSEIGKKSELGLLAKSFIDKGLLVPDDVVNNMVKSYLEHLEDKKNGFLLDGYPRTIDQAKAFDALAKGSTLAIDKVIALDIDFTILTGRITGRRICKECGEIYHITSNPSQVENVCDVCGGQLYQRNDDTVESLTIRLEEYSNQTTPVLDYYSQKGIVVKIDASQPIQNVWQDVSKALER